MVNYLTAMNPFNKILESTAIDGSSIHSYTTHATLQTSDDDDHFLEVDTATAAKMKEITFLVDRLRQLVGDFDTSSAILNSALSPTSQSTFMSQASPVGSLNATTDHGSLLSHTTDDNTILLNHYPTLKKLKNIDRDHSYPHSLSQTDNLSFTHVHGFASDTYSSSNSSSVYERYSSRYSLGVNRFSSTASKISSGTLSYINKDKLLNSSTRTPSKLPNTLSSRSSSNYTFSGEGYASALSSSKTEVMDTMHPTTEIPIFEEFYEIGISSNILHGVEQLRVSSLQPTEITSLHPERNVPIIHNLNEYCFPDGARLQYCSQKELSDLENSVASLRYQIMQFTDESNSTYYATCIISTEPLYSVRYELMRNLDGLMEFVAAINVIKRYIRFFIYKKKRIQERKLNAMWSININQVRRSSGGSFEPTATDASKIDPSKEKFRILKAFKKAIGKSFHPNKNNKKGGGPWRESHSHNLKTVVINADFSAGISKSAMRSGDPLNRSVITVEDLDLDPLDYPQTSMSFDQGDCYLTPKGKTTTTRRTLGTEDIKTSHKHSIIDLVDAIKLRATSDDNNMHSLTAVGLLSNRTAVVTEKAYCILSTKPMHVLYFQILEAIVLKEKSQAFLLQRLSTPIYSGRATYVDHQQLESPIVKNTLHRSNYLKYVQYCDCSALGTSNSSSNKSQIDLSMPEYIKSFKVSTDMLTLKEWTSALLLALLPPEIVVRVLCILLQEQSLLVYSSDAGLVTAVTTAFMLLLQPFTWEGIFVPLLPTAAYEALDAPVPYIIGVVSSSKPKVEIASCAAVLSIDDFLYHHEYYIPAGYDDVNFTKNELQRQRRRSSHDQVEGIMSASSSYAMVFYENPRVLPSSLQSSCGMPLLEPMLCCSFPDLRRLISYHRTSIVQSIKKKSRSHTHIPTAMIRSVVYDMSRGSIRSLRLVLDRISAFNSSLCGNILTQPAGWLQFGQNSREGHFEFTPKSFMKPYEAQLKFQENVINTQLFVSFMDQLSVDYCSRESQRRFISDWIYYRMLRRARRSKRTWI